MLPYRQSENPANGEQPQEKEVVKGQIEEVREDIREVTTGSPLNVHDILFCNAEERRRHLRILGELYGMTFTQEILPAPGSLSLTSLKCIVSTEEGSRYFLKQKAAYCSEERQLAKSALLQRVASEQMTCVPRIIHTAGTSNPHASIGNRAFLLTPYVDGYFFMGRPAQSFSCVETLGRIHAIGMRLEKPDTDVLNSYEETCGWIERLGQIATTDTSAKQDVLSRMKGMADLNLTRNAGRTGWLHGDFAPYNMVFDKADRVTAVNDFDNATYGPLARDVAECILTHCGIMYAGPSSSLRPPICTRLDTERGKRMLECYLGTTGIAAEDMVELREQFSLIWLELLSLGIVRGDFSFRDVQEALENYASVKNGFDVISQA